MSAPGERLPAREPLGRLASMLVAATLVLYVAYAALQTSIATDVWWALAAGRYILERGAIPRVDVFSHTYSGAPWVNGEWLSQVLFYAIYRWGGGASLALFKIAMAAGFYLVAAWMAWKRSGSLVCAAAVTASVVGCRTFFDIKSDLFLFAGTLALMAIVDAYRRGAPTASLLVLPVMFALWVNLHFGFVYGLGVVVLLAGAEVVKAWLCLPGALPGARVWPLATAVAAAAVACLVNPYGIQALTYPFAILDRGNAWRAGVTEWLPTLLFQEAPHNAAFFGWYFTAQCLLAVGVLLVAPGRFDIGNASHVALTAAMALGARRFVGLFALVAVPFGAANLAILWDHLSVRIPLRSVGPRARGAIAALLCALAVTFLARRGVPELRRSYGEGFFAGTVQESYFRRARWNSSTEIRCRPACSTSTRGAATSCSTRAVRSSAMGGDTSSIPTRSTRRSRSPSTARPAGRTFSIVARSRSSYGRRRRPPRASTGACSTSSRALRNGFASTTTRGPRSSPTWIAVARGSMGIGASRSTTPTSRTPACYSRSSTSGRIASRRRGC
jgi:hypothetical protein